MVKNPPAMRETWVWSWYWDDTPEKGMATHSNILAWRILLTIQSMGSQRVRHDWGTFTDIFRSRVSLQNPEGPLERELLQVCWVWAAGCGHASSVRPPFPPSLSSFRLTVTLRVRSWWETIHMVESSYVSFYPRRFSAWSRLMWREKRSLTEARNFASATGLDIFFAEMSILVTWCDQRTFHYLRMTRKGKGLVLIPSSGGQRTSPPEQMRTSSRVKNRAKLHPMSHACSV